MYDSCDFDNNPSYNSLDEFIVAQGKSCSEISAQRGHQLLKFDVCEPE